MMKANRHWSRRNIEGKASMSCLLQSEQQQFRVPLSAQKRGSGSGTRMMRHRQLRRQPTQRTGIFNYKDHWQLPVALQAGLDGEKKAEPEKDKVQQLSLKMFAEDLHGKLKTSGFDITAWTTDEQSEELALDAGIFKGTVTRVEFLRSV